jgi:hypothetical protein
MVNRPRNQPSRMGRPKGRRCYELRSPPALMRPSREKPLNVVLHELVVVGFREDWAVLTKLTCSMGCALRGARKDSV